MSTTGLLTFDLRIGRCTSLNRIAIAAAVCAAIQLVACNGGSQGSPLGANANSSVLQSTTPARRAAATLSTADLWIFQGPGLEAQAMATNPEGIAFFSNPAITVMYPVKANVPAPSAWTVILWQKYTSFATFQTAVAAGTVPAGTAVVGYDDELWSKTPANEQSNPIGYTIQFAQLAHQNNYLFVSMPAENLMQGLFPGKNKYASFITYGMAAQVAPYVDFYSIQAQGLELTPPSYASFTQTIVSQVQSANANAVITGGISTTVPNAPPVTAAQMDAAFAASMSMVAGYWLNIAAGTTPVAAAALANYP